MADFTVTHVLDGDTFDVSPTWNWKGESGSRVRPTGYDAPELNQFGGEAARLKLRSLILNKKVALGNAYRVDRGRIVCDVTHGGRSLADYFPEYRN